ncbi:MAG: AMP-binding protein, partial [Parvularculaceae bacterium]
MLAGQMQTTPLRVIDILNYAAAAHGAREIVSRLVEEPLWRYDYAALGRRAERCARVLGRLGVRPGDRVATLCWNTHRHLELFYAAPGIGAVLHTVNPRFFDDQILYTLEHAESRILFFDPNFLPLVERLAPKLRHIRVFVMTSDAARTLPGAVGAISYEALLAEETGDFDWPVFDENAGAILCYTSGTTGEPKGALYSHRAIVLHAMAVGLPGAFALDAFDVVMPCASMFHATAWGLPYAAPLNGAKLVLPCDKMDGASIQELIAGEGVTFTGGVPTIWTMYLDHLERTGEKPGALERVIIGGSAVPR